MEAQRGKTQKRKSQRESERKEGGKERERGGKNGPFAQNYSGEKQAQQTHIDNGRWHIKAS